MKWSDFILEYSLQVKFVMLDVVIALRKNCMKRRILFLFVSVVATAFAHSAPGFAMDLRSKLPKFTKEEIDSLRAAGVPESQLQGISNIRSIPGNRPVIFKGDGERNADLRAAGIMTDADLANQIAAFERVQN